MSAEDRISPQQRGENQRSGAVELVIVVYVCENFERCGGYYGSTSMGQLEEKMEMAPPTAKDAGQVRHARSRCSICGHNRVRRYARLVPSDEVAEMERKILARERH